MLFQFTHITDDDGNVLNRYEYDAFGNFTLKEETIENRFAFTGEQYDPVSQLYYLRARFYSPAIARFIQEDTYYGDGLNLYAYCHNNPVGYVDLSGNDSKSYSYEYFPYMFDKIDAENGEKSKIKDSNSTNLGKNIFQRVGVDTNTTGTGSHQKQHLIPQQVYQKSKMLQDMGFNVDSHWNGIFDKNKNNTSTVVNDIFEDVPDNLTKRYVSENTHHSGYHSLYNDAVQEEVDYIQDSIKKYHQELIDSGKDIKRANKEALKRAQLSVYMLTEDLRTMNQNGIDLYSEHGSNSMNYNDFDEYYREFKKQKQKAHVQNWHNKY